MKKYQWIKPMRMSRYKIYFVSFLLVATMLSLSACSSSSGRDDEPEDATPSLISQMVDKYQATLFEDDFNYTFERQEALLNDGKTIAFEGYLVDIWTSKNRTYLSLEGFHSPVIYVLESKMSLDQLKTLVGVGVDEGGSYWYDNFAVVAQIDSTKKVISALDAEVEMDGEDYLTDITSSASDALIASGELINIASNND